MSRVPFSVRLAFITTPPCGAAIRESPVTMYRTVFAFVLLAAATASANKPPEPVQFLDRSVVTFPVAAGDYGLAQLHYDPQQWVNGITSQWVVNAAPDGFRFTLFVYPLGRIDEAQAVAQQIAEIEGSMYEAVELGVYTDLTVGAREPFVVVAPRPSILEDDEKNASKEDGTEAPLDAVPKPEPMIVAGDDTDPSAATLAASLPATNSHGQRQSFGFRREGVAVRSLAYVFYRHLFAFKVRVTTPVDSMDEATFAALADTATRKLVPRIDVRNYGQCGKIAVSRPGSLSGEEAVPDTMTRQLIRGMARIRADNCAAGEGERPLRESRAAQRVEIVYPPDTWKPGD